MAAQTVTVAPPLLAWARRRSGRDDAAMIKKFPRLNVWEETGQLTLRQLEDFASYTHTPIGFLFLATPPHEELPIPDYRTLSDVALEQPSPDLLDTLYTCQLRQDWYVEQAAEGEQEPLGWVGSLDLATAPAQAATAIRAVVDTALDERRRLTTEAAFSLLTRNVEEAGALVMTSGIVGANTHRPLSVHEFRGFSLVNPLAPLIFINGVDTRAGTNFTLFHELAHLFVGKSGVDNPQPGLAAGEQTIEKWCNAVAAELLVPINRLVSDYREEAEHEASMVPELERLARIYKSSTLVVLSRLYDVRLLSWERYREEWEPERERVKALAEAARKKRKEDSDGGNTYNTLPIRNSRRFSIALITSAINGDTAYLEAARLLNIRSMPTLDRYAHELGVMT